MDGIAAIFHNVYPVHFWYYPCSIAYPISALIQKKNPTQADYSTIFFWNLGMAVLLYAILYFSAPYIASFYKIPLLCDVLRVQGIILFIYAFNIVQRNQLQKKLNFKMLSVVTIATSIISLTVTIIMAYHGYGVWSLVAQHILTALIPAIVFWFYIKWRPQFVFSVRSFRELFSFGFFMFLTHILNQFSVHVQGLLIGKFYHATTMGFYSKAHSTEKLASHSISMIMTQVTYPLYAEVQNNKEVLINMIKKLTATLAYVTFPLMFILLICAKPLFVFLYSEKWVESVPYFQILCIAGLGSCLQSINLQSIAAIGKSKIMFVWVLIKRSIGLFFIVGGLIIYGIHGLLIGVILNVWFSYFVNIGLVSKYIGYKWQSQLLELLPIFIVSIIAFFISFFISTMFDLNLYLDGLVKFGCYFVLYIGWSFLFKPKAYTYLVNIICKKYLK